jgi:AraC-like DNA-binding protein
VAGRVHLEDFSNPLWRATIARHRHSFLEAHLIVRGTTAIFMQNQRIELPSGSLLWVPPAAEHLTLEASAGLRRWILAMRAAAVRRTLPAGEAALLLSRCGPVACVQLGRLELRELAGVFEDVAGQASAGSAATDAGLCYALARAAVAHRGARLTLEPAAIHPSVARALSLMRGDGLLLGRDELAARCGLSASHLSRLFVQELGQPLRAVRNLRRLARFQELLESGACQSRTEAALEAGFGSYSQFHRVRRRFSAR